MTTIRLRQNGPLVIDSDDVIVVDWHGTPYEVTRRPIALCRCGGSSTKPFCDGSHRTNGFCGGDPAFPPSTPSEPADGS
jgi:CDGSH-type Zn-finger protein